MKMTKIESARIIAESTDNPVCRSILCSKCFNSRKGKACKDGNLVAIEKAKAYIKRHESKTKKKDHITDASKKVEEPKPFKTVGIDNSDVTLAKPTVKENLSVPCEHLINGDSCGNAFEPCDKDCPANSEIPQPIKFDDPVPENVYVPAEDCIRFYNVIEYVLKKRKTLKSSTDEFLIYLRNPRTNDTLWVDARECYRTLEEAVIVAKRLWSIK